MKQITFAEFYQECKGKLSLNQLRDLEPSSEYFKCSDAFIGLDFYPQKKGIWISIAVGRGPVWLQELKKECLNIGVGIIGFLTTEDNEAVNTLARYYGATLRDTDIQGKILYEINFTHRRFKTFQEAA